MSGCEEYLNVTWIKMKFITQDRIVKKKKKVMQMEQAENRVQWLAFVKWMDGSVH